MCTDLWFLQDPAEATMTPWTSDSLRVRAREKESPPKESDPDQRVPRVVVRVLGAETGVTPQRKRHGRVTSAARLDILPRTAMSRPRILGTPRTAPTALSPTGARGKARGSGRVFTSSRTAKRNFTKCGTLSSCPESRTVRRSFARSGISLLSRDQIQGLFVRCPRLQGFARRITSWLTRERLPTVHQKLSGLMFLCGHRR